MNAARRERFWTAAGVLALALTVGAVSSRGLHARAGRAPDIAAADEGLRDAVASPSSAPATAGLAGKPVPTSWFKTPEQHHAEMDSALLSSRRRRAQALSK